MKAKADRRNKKQNNLPYSLWA